MEEQEYGRSFPGCMKGLVHFLDLHHHLHLRKMKMLTYRKHGEGKRAARKKEPKTDPDAPSTSHQYVCFEDTSFGEEDKVNIRKHQMKLSMRIFISKWGLREDNKKRKVPPPASRLLRTFSIHHWREDHVDNMNFGVETLVVEQNVDVNKASSSSERVYVLSRSSDEHINDKQCDGNMAYRISGSLGPSPSDELENILQMNQLHQSNILNEAELSSFAQKDTNAKEQQEDVILYPSKEFLAMMKLFNGNSKLIRNILDDPSFIFVHYLQDKQASNAELTRGYSFQAPWQLERKNDGKFGFMQKKFENESLVKQSDKFLSEDLPTYTDKIEEDAPKEEMVDGDEEITPKHTETTTGSAMVAPWSTFQNVRINPPNSNRFMTMEHNKKEHHRIFMDGILHKIPFGRKVMEAMKRSKSGWWDGSNIKKPDGEGLIHSSWNKNNKHAKKSIQRSQSLDDSLDKYSHLYESIAKEEFKGLPKRMKVKSFGRLFSLPDIKYCPPSKKNHSEATPFSSHKNLTSSYMEKIHEKEESKESTTEVSSKSMVIDCENIPLQSSEKEQSEFCQIPKNLTEDGLTKEHRSITPQGEKLLDEAYAVSATWSLARDLEFKYPSSHSYLLDINAIDGLQSNERDLAKSKSSPDIDCFDSLHLQMDQKEEAKFNFVREILKIYGFSDSEFLEARHYPYQPMDLLLFNEAEDLSYELDFSEDEHDMLLEHQLLFELINKALVETYEKFFASLFPWLSRFSTNTRPMPMGSHILEDLKDQPQLGITLEDIVFQNFTKNDGWMNIQFDIEDVVCELESLLLDALLDDAVLQLSLMPASNQISCSLLYMSVHPCLD